MRLDKRLSISKSFIYFYMSNIDSPLQSEQGIWNSVYDRTNNRLCVSAANTNSSGPLLSDQEILNRVFDSTNNQLLTQ